MKKQKNKSKNLLKGFQVFVFAISIIVGVLSIVQGVQLFYIGFHNMDLAYNGCVMSNDLGLQYRGLMDEYTFGKTMSLTDFYHLALEQMESGMRCVMLGAFAFGVGITSMAVRE
jgi:hypothetical protein